MKNIFRINVMLLILLLSCKENKSDINKNQNLEEIVNNKILKDSISKIVKNTDSINISEIDFKSLKISQLPIGYPNLFKKNLTDKKNIFITNITDGTPYEPFLSLISSENKSDEYLNIIIKSNQSFYFDFNIGLLINNNEVEKKSLKYYQYVGRIPDIKNLKVLIFKQIGLTYKSNEYMKNIDEMYEIIVFNSEGKFQTSLNIASVGSIEYEKNTKIKNKRFYKVFYIENSSEIKIKYIQTSGEETKSEVIYETKFKITDTGKIIQWFEQEKGIFKNDFEVGELENHLKVGVWSEFCDNNTQEVEIFYNNGIPQKDDIDFYRREKFDGSFKRFGPEHQIKNGILVK